MKQLILFFLLLPSLAWAHGGDDHGEAAKPAAAAMAYFTSETFSDKYEALVKYSHTDPGKEASLKLFISQFNTNQALDPVQLNVTVAGHPAIKLEMTRLEKGIYLLKGIFPDTAHYNLIVNVDGPQGADLLQLNDVDPGRVLPIETEATAHSHWYQSNWFYGFLGLLFGIIFMYIIMKKRNHRITAVIILFYCLLPLKGMYNASAHEGHDEPGGKSGAVSSAFLIEKETQFLFNIHTQKLEPADYNTSTVFFGTVTAAPDGKAVIQSPQTGKIVSLKVKPGQPVSRGQVVAVIEQQVDAGTQINILSQKNSIDAEYNAAKAQYERLKKIEDIAAKKDITEAKARYESAADNKRLFEANTTNSSGSSRFISLTSPVSGITGSFNYAIGAVVNAGETLFGITNLDRVYIETQVFVNDVPNLKSVKKFTASVSESDSMQYDLKLVSVPQSVNPGNQSQLVVFEVINPKGQFKIGANVQVRSYSGDIVRQLILPNEAITEVNGRPVVFIKDKAEQYSISFILKGENNNQYSIISRGAEEGERVVVNNVYQMKMIYLNQ
ncbi:MAG TPA: efflux RND transporter periplasmic adaptor subunit [Chitinophagaceae bacterium]|nr:efflux RND transporter periplasmic adaptor subunit [Chitinophagaceae bacterium]